MTGGAAPRAAGDYFERQTRAALEAQGWYVVRAAGSHGIADLVAMRAGSTPLLVSCKLGGRIGPGERRALRDTADASGGRAVVALRARNGWVQLGGITADAMRVIPLEALKVPTRQRVST